MALQRLSRMALQILSRMALQILSRMALYRDFLLSRIPCPQHIANTNSNSVLICVSTSSDFFGNALVFWNSHG